MVSFTVYFRERRIGILHASLHPAAQRATGYFDPDGDLDRGDIERGLVAIQSLDGTLAANNVWLRLYEERGALEAEAEIRSPEFWAAAGGR